MDGWPATKSVRARTGRINQGQPSTAFWDWSEAQFRQLDRNGDNRISRIEWARYDIEDFIRIDQNGDNVLTMREFMLGDVDDDRGDRFAYLDMNNNNRIDPGPNGTGARPRSDGSIATAMAS